MKLPSYQFFAQMAAAFAVVVSLGFVAYELKLARDVAKAEVYQQRTAMDQNYRLHMLDAEATRKAVRKLRNGEEALSEDEIADLLYEADTAIMSAENVFYQYQLGLLDEEEWKVWRRNMNWMLSIPCYRDYFNRNRDGYRKEFAAEIEDIYSQIPSSECILSDSE